MEWYIKFKVPMMLYEHSGNASCPLCSYIIWPIDVKNTSNSKLVTTSCRWLQENHLVKQQNNRQGPSVPIFASHLPSKHMTKLLCNYLTAYFPTLRSAAKPESRTKVSNVLKAFNQHPNFGCGFPEGSVMYIWARNLFSSSGARRHMHGTFRPLLLLCGTRA